MNTMVQVSVIMGSESDRTLGEKTKAVLEEFNIPHELVVLSAHRNPEALKHYIDTTRAEIFIAIAGLSAALPGTIAAQTIRPVIGVPKNVKLGGLDALLSIAQMPSGIPVATMGIDNARNGALMAIHILATKNDKLKKKIHEYREKRART